MASAKIKIRKCPKCKASKIMLHVGGLSGMYECKECGYVGPIILEEEVDA